MKIRLKHIGYSLLFVTLFFNFWFYRFNLWEQAFGDYECSYANPCRPGAWDVISEPWEGWNEEFSDDRSVEMGTMAITNSILERMTHQVYWIELFLTAMLDTIAIALAFALIFHPENKK